MLTGIMAGAVGLAMVAAASADRIWLADLNGDGVVNALDVFIARSGTPIRPHGGIASSESIVVDPAVASVSSGQNVAIKLRLLDNTTPLFGYSISVHASPLGGTVGAMLADVGATNFYSAQNLVDAAPGDPPLDPLFTVILPAPGGGVFLSTNTADGSTVVALPGVNDVLAEVWFHASPGAQGAFEILLGAPTVLADGGGFAVPYSYSAGVITVTTGGRRDPDLNGDGVVNGADLGLMLGDWGTCVTLPADLNLDDIVNGADLGIFLASWGASGGPADLNQSGLVDGADLGALLGDWGAVTPPCADLTGDGFVDGADLGVLLGAWL